MTVARIVAVSTDLMDRSKLTAGLPDAHVVRPGAVLDGDVVAGGLVPGGLGEGDVVILDLSLVARHPELMARAVSSGARVVAYGSHIDDGALDAARVAGAEAMPRSVFFRRLGEGTLIG